VEGAAGVELVRLVARGAFEADAASGIVGAVADSAREVLGEVRMRGEPFWTDAGLIADAGIPCVVIGVAGGGAHADDEWATIWSIERLADIVERAIIRFCA
jgi:acetylornithine deacetylase